MRIDRRRILRLGGGAAGFTAASLLLSACGEEGAEEKTLTGWTTGQNIGGQEVSAGQPGGVPDERAVLGLKPGRLVIAEINFNDATSSVVIENRNTAQESLINWTLASNGNQWTIPGAVKLQPGESLTIGYGDGVDEGFQVFMNGALGSPDPASGELGLFTDSLDLSSWIYMHQYLQWGEPGQPLAPVAIEANLWAEGEVVTVSAGGSITYDETLPGDGTFTGFIKLSVRPAASSSRSSGPAVG